MKVRKIKNWVDGLSEKELDEEFEIRNVNDITEGVRIKGMIKNESMDWDMNYTKAHCLLVNPIVRYNDRVKHHYHISIEEDSFRRFLRKKRLYHVLVDEKNFIAVDNFKKAMMVKEKLEMLLNE